MKQIKVPNLILIGHSGISKNVFSFTTAGFVHRCFGCDFPHYYEVDIITKLYGELHIK